MQIIRIKVGANIAAQTDACKAAQLIVDDQCNKTTDMADSGKKAEIDFTNVELTEFGVYTIMLLADSICKTCCKQAIDDFTKYSNNNLITSLIINIEAESATQMEESFTICHCQFDKLDRSNIGDINHVRKDVI